MHHHHHQQDSSSVQVYNMAPVPDQSDNFDSDGSNDDQADNSNTGNGGGIDLDLSANPDLRKLAMESTETLEALAAKTNSAAPGAAADKARSLFVTTWLFENYEVEEDHNVPRSSMYAHYNKVCQQQGVRPVNSASFGKLIRTVFPILKTRSHEPPLSIDGQPSSFTSLDQQSLYAHPSLSSGGAHVVPSAHHFQSANPDDKEVVRLPEFSPVLETGPPQGVSISAAQQFIHQYYRVHCQQILEKIQMTKFLEVRRTRRLWACGWDVDGVCVESVIERYWQDLPHEQREVADTPEMIEHICRADSVLYEFCMSVLTDWRNMLSASTFILWPNKTVMTSLLPSVLHMMPINLIQTVRHFARQLEFWIATATTSYSQELRSVAHVFTQQLRRHTSLNHLAQAAAAVLESPEQMTAMMIDWGRIDFENIRDQASWVCECHKNDIMQNSECRLVFGFLRRGLCVIRLMGHGGRLQASAEERGQVGELDKLAGGRRRALFG
ncbi:RFX DNA-binding domain-containing protein [Jimgerdemannia flammicorona]|uniref:RFX DNA-binding domain-containing protein n=1 Tax=Jimgerdemannia flammicorona TaxID=994334 RepID=A0A433DI64_9FUNG|nr:RFX DNA-binding domain-containing protein [Jimgerdemannia flammicorona]